MNKSFSQDLVIVSKKLNTLLFFVNKMEKKTYNYSTKENRNVGKYGLKQESMGISKVWVFHRKVWALLETSQRNLSTWESFDSRSQEHLEIREMIFQAPLQEDFRLIYNSKKTMTFADKTSNMYRLTKEKHNKLLRNAITSKYEKTNTKIKEG